MRQDEHAWRVPAEPSQVRAIRHEIAELIGHDGLNAEREADVVLAVSEAATNAVRHGFPDGHVGSIDLRVRWAHNRVWVTVTDDGVGLRERGHDPGAGLGISLIEALADEVSLRTPHGGGVRLDMLFTAAGPTSA